jgi:hypothetical protein
MKAALDDWIREPGATHVCVTLSTLQRWVAPVCPTPLDSRSTAASLRHDVDTLRRPPRPSRRFRPTLTPSALAVRLTVTTKELAACAAWRDESPRRLTLHFPRWLQDSRQQTRWTTTPSLFHGVRGLLTLCRYHQVDRGRDTVLSRTAERIQSRCAATM